MPTIEQPKEMTVADQTLKIGDVLGQDFDLPEGLERLNGWLVYNFSLNGTPQALEPIESAPEGVVNWNTGLSHVEKTLKNQGHANARLWSWKQSDGSVIFNNIVQGGYNDKAELDVSGSNPNGRYWDGIQLTLGPGGAVVHYLDIEKHIDWKSKNDVARVRAVQDIPELSR